jgi:hypothetical protein
MIVGYARVEVEKEQAELGAKIESERERSAGVRATDCRPNHLARHPP